MLKSMAARSAATAQQAPTAPTHGSMESSSDRIPQLTTETQPQQNQAEGTLGGAEAGLPGTSNEAAALHIGTQGGKGGKSKGYTIPTPTDCLVS